MSDWVKMRRAAAALAFEALLATLVVGPFLYLYAGHSAGGEQAVLPHLRVVGVVWLTLACLRMAAWRWLPWQSVARGFAALATGIVVVSLSAYYVLVLIGLWSWGRVVSGALISNYVGQVPALAQSLGVSLPLLAAGLILGVGLVLVLLDLLFTRHDWTRWPAAGLGTPVALVVAGGGLALALLEGFTVVTSPPVKQREPISLTLFGEEDQSHLASQTRASPELVAQARADRAAYRPAEVKVRPNVVLVVVDALRADRMAPYGYARPTTPFLTSLQQQGRMVVVRNMVAACPESFCGLLAIARSKPLHMLTDEDLSLHQVLRLHGYRIKLILAGDHTNFYGLRRAYGAVDDYFDGSMASKRNVNDDELVLEQVRALPEWDGQPVFLQVHLMSSHLLGLRDPKFAQFLPAKPYVPWRKGAAKDLSRPQAETGNYYDNGILQMDDVVRRLVATLTERRYMNNTILVLTGDHGEMLGEHGEYGHAKSVFEPAMRIPLLFAGFGGMPPTLDATSPGLASQLDIAPTLLQQIGIPAPHTWVGVPLQRPLPARQLAFQQGHFVGLYDRLQPGRTLKYWRQLHTGEERAYDVDTDPGEAQDLWPTLDSSRREALRAAAQPIAAAVIK